MADYVIGSLASQLKNNATVTAQLTAATDVYLSVAPPDHGAKYITISQIPGGENAIHQEGSSGLTHSVYQVSCWAETEAIDAAAIANAVRIATDILITGGTLGTAPNNVTVRSVVCDDYPGTAIFAAPRDGGSVGTEGIALTVSVWHAITLPS
jgi:uncharacterized protein YraI